MARPSSAAPRNLTLTEELERLEQSITLTLQEIDSNFAKAHRIVSTSILPIVERYAKNSEAVWEGSKFWREFFEAAANVSLNGYEQADMDESAVNTEADTSHTDESNSITGSDIYISPSQALHDDEDLTITSPERTVREHLHDDDPILSSPSLAHNHSTPRAPRPNARSREKAASRDATDTKFADYSSPYETLRREMYGETGAPPRQAPITPGKRPPALPDMSMTPGSSPFVLPPESAFKNANKDTILHQGVLNKTYRVAATPLTSKRAQRAAMAGTPAWVHTLDSTLSSPDVPEPQLTAAIFSSPMKPGRSVMTPGRKKAVFQHRQSRRRSSKGLVASSAKVEEPAIESRGRSGYTARSMLDWESDDEEMPEFSPPKTMRFELGENRLIQTPARDASRRIVEDLLYSAGGDMSDGPEEYSPSIVGRDHNFQDETF